MHFTRFLVASLGVGNVFALSSIHKRAAKYERKSLDLTPRGKPHLEKRESPSYLTAKTKRELPF